MPVAGDKKYDDDPASESFLCAVAHGIGMRAGT